MLWSGNFLKEREKKRERERERAEYNLVLSQLCGGIGVILVLFEFMQSSEWSMHALFIEHAIVSLLFDIIISNVSNNETLCGIVINHIHILLFF